LSKSWRSGVVGERITVADIAVATQFVNLEHLNCGRDRARHGRVYAFIDSILARPSFASWIERETAFLAKEPG